MIDHLIPNKVKLKIKSLKNTKNVLGFIWVTNKNDGATSV